MLLKTLTITITAAYPFIVYFGLNYLDAESILWATLLLAASRWFTDRKTSSALFVVMLIAGLLSASYIFGSQQSVKLYPVFINSGMLLIFGASLFAKQTVVEKIARITEPNLPEKGVTYTRNVTIIWCLFFIVNGSIAFYTAVWASKETWLFYNGFLSYILIGSLMTGEWIVRTRMKPGK